MQVAALDLRCSTADLCQLKWTKFLGWCDQQGVIPCKATIPQVGSQVLSVPPRRTRPVSTCSKGIPGSPEPCVFVVGDLFGC